MVTRGTETIEADSGRVNEKTGEVVVRGHVTHTRGADVWQGENLVYNFKSKTYAVENMKIDAVPLRSYS